ncbi:hypothetical protein P1J78_18105 [Psychromarinibacter sp. C21-152]|uniref:DUF3052 domain-containing protein n=1 Tax=Psychromarinibacter sediminicola TaxID=3033385 RepID=A0AAE3NV89_9RHOB|nr:hypothetical protein [Psychromarinibacter sediminicola]MDF0602656.1 hypothetical protein [Psychromarinibacter sediminicola]
MATAAGYSGTPLPKKLGFKPGWSVLVHGAPPDYADLLAGADDVAFLHDTEAEGVEAVHLFLRAPEDLDHVPGLLARLVPGGMLWLSWAKKSSKLHAGITEDDLRAAVLPLGWVDVKVCAVDADWSGLKFLKRRA